MTYLIVFQTLITFQFYNFSKYLMTCSTNYTKFILYGTLYMTTSRRGVDITV
jgi:hypothetical protein